MVSCQKGPICHAYTWQIGPFWQDTLDVCVCVCNSARPRLIDWLDLFELSQILFYPELTLHLVFLDTDGTLIWLKYDPVATFLYIFWAQWGLVVGKNKERNRTVRFESH